MATEIDKDGVPWTVEPFDSDEIIDRRVTFGHKFPDNPKAGDIHILPPGFDASSEAVMFDRDGTVTRSQLNAANIRIGEQSEIIVDLEGRLEDALTRSYEWAALVGVIGLAIGYGLSLL